MRYLPPVALGVDFAVNLAFHGEEVLGKKLPQPLLQRNASLGDGLPLRLGEGGRNLLYRGDTAGTAWIVDRPMKVLPSSGEEGLIHS